MTDKTHTCVGAERKGAERSHHQAERKREALPMPSHTQTAEADTSCYHSAAAEIKAAQHHIGSIVEAKHLPQTHVTQHVHTPHKVKLYKLIRRPISDFNSNSVLGARVVHLFFAALAFSVTKCRLAHAGEKALGLVCCQTHQKQVAVHPVHHPAALSAAGGRHGAHHRPAGNQ